MAPGAPDLDRIVVRRSGREVAAIEAEAPQNQRNGMARVDECPRCSGGKSVVGIGYEGGGVALAVRIPEAGIYDVDIQFAVPYYGQNRDHFKNMTLFASANGGPRKRIDLPYVIPERYNIGNVSVALELKQGDNVILLDNPSSQEDVRLSYLKTANALQHTGA
jgi:hypothetical protein